MSTHTHTHTQRERERERGRDTEGKQDPCREPDVGLDPGTPGSRPGPKAGAKPLSHPGIPLITKFILTDHHLPFHHYTFILTHTPTPLPLSI